MIGHVVSHYRVLQKLGGGGMGVLYKAEDLKLRRTVALKFLAPELTRDDDAKKRFLHEAQAASALDHPNICGIYEIDETPEGQMFIAMPCYDGESLKQRIARRRLDVEEAFQIAFAVAQGLARAHASGIIHRDIKPGNVMITNDGFVKIIDFGLSKLLGRSRVTGSGVALGTVSYMAPEQARSEHVDARVDIWALGAILYEMLTGQVPFRGEIDQAVVYSILNEAPKPVREIRSDVPEPCAAIIARCLEKSADDRYQSVEDFSVAVFEAGRKLGWGDSFATAGVRAVSVVRVRARRSRRFLPLVATAVIVLAVVGWAGLRERIASPYSTKVRLAIVPFERIGDSPSQALVDGVTYEANRAFQRASRVHRSMWVLPQWRVTTDRPATVDRFRTAFGVNRIVTGSVTPFENGHRLMLALRDADSEKELRAAAVDIDLDRLPELLDGVAARFVGVDSSRFSAMHDMNTAGDNAGALLEALGLMSRPVSRGDPNREIEILRPAALADTQFAPAATALGHAYMRAYERDEDQAHRVAAEHWLKLGVGPDSTGNDALQLLAMLCARDHRTDDGVALLKRAIQNDPGDMVAYERLGWVLVDAQRYAEAEDAYRTLVERFPDYHYSHWLLGWLYNTMGRHDEQFSELRTALSLAPDDHRALNTMGLYHSDRGEWSRAREHWERAFLMRPNCATCGNVGYVLYFEGRYADSARYFEYALEYCDTTKFKHWGNLASALYWAEGGRERAKRMYRRAIEKAGERLREVPDDAITASWLADYNAMLGNREEAMRMVAVAENSSESEVMYRIGEVYEHTGDRVRALHYIGEAIRKSYPLYEIMNEPVLQELRKDPRFLQLVASEQASARAGQRSR